MHDSDPFAAAFADCVALHQRVAQMDPQPLLGAAAARARGVVTVALTGRDGGVVGCAADLHVNVPSESTPRVQEAHRTLLHVLCDLVERAVVA